MFDGAFNELSNEDVVRVCILYLLEKSFNGRLSRQSMKDETLDLVSNLDEFNGYRVANL